MKDARCAQRTSCRARRAHQPNYAELHCLSNFSFQRGASTARELFERARDLGYTALAITDECTLAGIVRAYEAARDTGVKLIVGAEFALDDGPRLVLLCEDLTGYQSLCELITRGRRASEKGTYRLTPEDLSGGLPGTLALWLPGDRPDLEQGRWLAGIFEQRLWLAVELHAGPDDGARLEQLRITAARLDLPMVAAGDVHMHARGRRALQDTLIAIRHRCSVAEAGDKLFRNGERHLRPRDVLARIYPPELLEESTRIAARCRFSLDELQYHYPSELVPDGHTPTSWLRELAGQGLRRRWPGGAPARVKTQVEHELDLISGLGYEPYFLTVQDIVRFAREHGILCQGRGSAANSAVCYVLGITEVDPDRINLLVERFISAERGEPPDIDVDFEHERREEIIQYVYRKYGRGRAALTATVVCYRGKSAVRDIARALGLPAAQLDQLSRALSHWDGGHSPDERLRERGFDPGNATIRRVIALTRQLLGFPRHLSQHVGGFVISDAPLSTLVPVENAAMQDRTIIQWDKDDLEALGMLKVDILALGMLTCIRKCLDLLRAHRGRGLTLATIPTGDPETYRMIQRGDTVGVFQIESRAQMAMLPRHRPANYYDLVVQVAIVRPGPIQGDMVHPYLKRRHGQEAVSYPSADLEAVLERTLGVPLFQEQAMRIAIVAAGYTPGEADHLRRSMAAWKRYGDIESHRRRIVDGMLERGYDRAFAERLFEQLKGFGDYGFPESHAASFAGLVYASCWLKCHEPAAFACALLNSQPLGFYAPAQIIADARRHGVEIRPVDVRYSSWDSTLEPKKEVNPPLLQKGGKGGCERGEFINSGGWTQSDSLTPIRLGFHQIQGFQETTANRITAARDQHPFADITDLCARAGLDRHERRRLADAGALRGLAGHRHRARWSEAGIESALPMFGHGGPAESPVPLPPPSRIEDAREDYRSLGLSLDAHPLKQLRPRLRPLRYTDSHALKRAADGTHARAAGLVTHRQRPMTAGGVTFVTLEDEYGLINLIVWRRVGERYRRTLLEAKVIGASGYWQTSEGVGHLVVQRLDDLGAMLGPLHVRGRDFR